MAEAKGAESVKVRAYVKDGKVAMKDDLGDSVWVEKSQLGSALSGGYTPVTKAQHADEMKRRRAGEQSGQAFLESTGSAATLGLSDYLLRETGTATAEQLRLRREENPLASGAGSVVGTIGSAALPGGIIGKAGQLGAKVAAKATASKAAQVIAGAAVEGAVIGTGQGVSEAVLHEMGGGKAAEHIVKSAAKGGVVGAGFGVAGLGAGAAARFVGGKIKKLDPLNKPMAARHVRRAEKAQKTQLGKAATQLEKGQRAEYEMAMARAETEGAFASAAKARGKDFRRSDYVEAAKQELNAAQREAAKLGELLEADAFASAKFAQGAERRLKSLESRKIPRLEQGVLESELGFAGSLLAKATEEGAESVMKRQVGAAIGTVVGGLPGMVIGSLLQPAANKLVRRAIVSGAPLIRRGIQGAGAAAQATGKATAASSTKALTATEYTQLSRQLRENPPEVMALKIQAAAPAGASPEAIQKATSDASNLTSFLTEKLPQPPPGEAQRAPAGSRDWAPDGQSLKRYSRYLRAAMDPASVPQDFATGRLTPEAMETIDRLHPGMATEMRSVVSEELQRAQRMGQRYDRKKAQQIALVLGDDGVKPRMYDHRVVIALQANFAKQQEQKAASGAAPSLDKQNMSKLQGLLTRNG